MPASTPPDSFAFRVGRLLAQDGVVAGVRGDARTIDFTTDYRIGRGALESLWLRLRASWLDVESAPQDGTDFRVILRYELPVI